MFTQPGSKILFFTALLAAVTAIYTIGEAGIDGITYCPSNSSRNVTKIVEVPVMRGEDNFLILKGAFTDLATYSANSEISLTKVSTTCCTNPTARLRLHPSNSIGTGRHHVTATYPNGNTETFYINILAPVVDKITISPFDFTVTKNRLVTITVTGSGLDNTQLKTSLKSRFTNLQGQGTSNSQKVFSGNLQSSSNYSAVSFYDNRLPEDCDGSSGPNRASGSGSLSLTVGLPDLAPIPANVYRMGNSTHCGRPPGDTSEPHDTAASLCSLITAPDLQNQHIEQLVSTHDISWGVKNLNKEFEADRPFVMRLTFGINTLQEVTVQADFGVGEVEHYVRPENRRLIQRDFNCSSCIDVNIAPYNWADPAVTVTVDATRVIDEGPAETNNSVTSN